MEFLSTLTLDVKLLLVAGALALLGALFSVTKKSEHRYVALFTVVMLLAGYRFHQHERENEAAAAAPGHAPAVQQSSRSNTARANTR